MKRILQRSAHLLDRLFNIRAAERPRVTLLFIMIALTSAAYVWGSTLAYATFLQQVGLSALPWVIVWAAALSILANAVYSAFADRISNERLLIAIYGLGAAGIGLGLLLLWLQFSWFAFPLLYLLSQAWLAVLNPHFITYANSFYDTQSAKRVLPVITAGARAGAIVAGVSMSVLTAYLSSGLIVVGWLLIYLLVIALIIAAPFLLKERKFGTGALTIIPPAGTARQQIPYLDNVREGFRYTLQSSFLRWMAAGILLLMILMSVIEYRSNDLLLQIYGSPEALANFLAMLVGVGNVFVLPMLLLGISRLISKIGLGNAKLVFPAGNLLICGGLIFTPGLITASLAYLDRTSFRMAFQAPIDNLLYNAVPLRVKARARAFVEGLVSPGGLLLGGLLLFLPFLSLEWFISTLIAVLVVGYAVSAWFTRRQYSRALVDMLEQEDFSTLLFQDSVDLTVTDPAVLNRLREKLAQNTGPEFTIFMAQLIAQVGGEQATTILSDVVRRTDNGRVRASILDILTAAHAQGETARQLYTTALSDPDGQVRLSAVAGLEQLAGPSNQQFTDQILPMVHDPDVHVRAGILSTLARAGDFYRLPAAEKALNELLANPEPYQRAYGVQLLGEIRTPRSIRELPIYLDDPADEVRLEAINAVDTLSREVLPRLQAKNQNLILLVIKKITPLLQDPIERAREAAVEVLGRLGTQDIYPDLAGALADPSPQVRAVAAEILTQIGKAVIPTVHPRLDSPDPQIRKMAAVVLSRINEHEFGPLVKTQITGNLVAIYQNYSHLKALSTCHKGPGLIVLQAALRDQNQQFIDEIFFLLTAFHDAHAIETITDSLKSETAHVRANAIEALESLTSPETARLIAPLFEPDLPPARLLAVGREVWEMTDPQPAATLKQLVKSEVPWLRAITVYALGELGANGQPSPRAEPQPDAGQKTPKRRRRGPAKLLDVLDEVGKPEADQEDAPKSRRRRPVDVLGMLAGDSDSQSDEPATAGQPAAPESSAETVLPRAEIETIVMQALDDPADTVQDAARIARKMLEGRYNLEAPPQEEIMLSVIEKIIFLKEVHFFERMTINQLEVLANVAEEKLFEEDVRIFDEGDPGGVLYVVVNGKVAIEREGARKGSTIRLATYGPHSYFGEVTLFDGSPRSASAIAVQDTLTLSLRREPLIALARQYPDLSLELIHVLSLRLREASDQISKLTRTRPREIHKLFDKFDDD